MGKLLSYTAAWLVLAAGRGPGGAPACAASPTSAATAWAAHSAARLQLRGGAEFDPYDPGAYGSNDAAAPQAGEEEGAQAPHQVPVDRKEELVRQFTAAVRCAAARTCFCRVRPCARFAP